MAKNDPFGFDMSVSSAKKKKNTRGRRGMSGASETSTRVCEHEGCEEPGVYRAPKAPDVLDEYYWFCKEHIREYNLKWNFFDGTTEAEMNAQMSKDKVWERTTKPLGDPEARAWARLGIEDPHQVLGDNATRNPGRNGGATAGRRLPPTERRALEILEGKDHWTKAEVRKAYKSLIKVLHPDMNGGDRSQEEQLQEVMWAWDQIKDSRNFK
ncbi:DnaJ domain-containing protein [Pseudooceanicola sp. 502str34]|uniref:J domain-containing protein n=1 Tax=Maritimibacter alkaliphilus TaxID=404236 RepID=UPI001C972E69|nr:J domain-containing protein [Maritimibacter alkaliphilus]MBY6090193.1 J domain-containing protein [Maritimibacter alkaliphilus]